MNMMNMGIVWKCYHILISRLCLYFTVNILKLSFGELYRYFSVRLMLTHCNFKGITYLGENVRKLWFCIMCIVTEEIEPLSSLED